MIRGTRKKMICPESCFTIMIAFSRGSFTSQPATRPIATAISSLKMVFDKIFFHIMCCVF